MSVDIQIYFIDYVPKEGTKKTIHLNYRSLIEKALDDVKFRSCKYEKVTAAVFVAGVLFQA
jgi:hypothetical protein